MAAELIFDDLSWETGRSGDRRKGQIADTEWRRTVEFSRKLLAGGSLWLRDGRPMESFKVGRLVELPAN